MPEVERWLRDNAINSSARLVLNVHREAMADTEPGSELLVAHTPEDVARFVQEIEPVRARRIGEAARARALRDHSYADRARRVDELLRAGVA